MSPSLKTFFPLILVSVLLVFITVFGGWEELSSFGVGIAKYTASLIVVWFVDNVLVPHINTMEKLNENAIAYSLFLFANFILAGICIGTS